MSEPKRYEPNSSTCVVMLRRDHGEYVLHSEYALLRQQYTDLVQERGETIAALQAELERLRAAGDQMLGTMLWAAHKNPDGPAEKRILAWINARDGNEEAAK